MKKKRNTRTHKTRHHNLYLNMKKRKTHKQKHLGGVTLEASLYAYKEKQPILKCQTNK